MNQDQVKNLLLQLDDTVDEFTVIFSGKQSSKVDGLYHPETFEIIIHNKNFNEDNLLIYTAIHEFAHHIQFTRHRDTSKRSHNILFWNIFHGLIEKAIEKKLYESIFDNDVQFLKLTKEIRDNFITVNGDLMKSFGKVLIQALEMCQKKHAIFEDYIDRILGMGRNSAKTLMSVYAQDIDPKIGYENMKIVSGIKKPSERMEAEKEFLEGKTQSQVKSHFNTDSHGEDISLKKLQTQKRRIVKSISSLNERLEDIDSQIEELEGVDG